MTHTPYGYKIVDGKVIINEKVTEKIRALFQNYLDGMALTKAVEQVGMKLYHGSAGRMLRNKYYLEDDYYPQLIDKEIFDNNNKFKVLKRIVYGRSGLVNLEKKCKLAFLSKSEDFSLSSLL